MTEPPEVPADAGTGAEAGEILAEQVVRLVDEAVAGGALVVVLTGAGVSAASGIPTFRGPEGYWTVGSDVYAPQEIATAAMFERAPEAVWGWYRYRLGVVRGAEPNPAHHALAELEVALGDRFLLVTQNVDGLHRRAGSSADRTFEIHGALEWMRCATPCHRELLPMPAALVPVEAPAESSRDLSPDECALLTCPRCGGWTRPHVLWFDEAYDERWFRLDSTLTAAGAAGLLVTVGTSGATNLPNQLVQRAVFAGAALVDANPDPNPFGDLAGRLDRGAVVRSPASLAVPALAACITAAVRTSWAG